MAKLLRELVVVCLWSAHCAVAGHSDTAFDGPDFVNNLFSDLAPILALFGERVTQQYMSQSIGWADNILLAMAPLGIVTALVGAIRVGGPAWLKAIVGRARENLAAAEVDLMSSTSDEVCEVWNGREIVRVMGVTPVTEFICLLPRDKDLRDAEGALRSGVKVLDIETAIKMGYLSTTRLSLSMDIGRWFKKATLEDGDGEKDEIVIVYNSLNRSPNIIMNCHDSIWRGSLRMAAAFGVLLQIGVVIYFGATAYKWHWTPGQHRDYAFPFAAGGTLLLVLGMILCAHVVESATMEVQYETCRNRVAQMVWLQKESKVSEQTFKACAIFSENPRTIITTSNRATGRAVSRKTFRELITPNFIVAWRAGKLSDAGSDSTEDYADAFVDILEIKTLVGVTIGIMGFIFQFLGFRALHWSAALVQLGATGLMTVLRVWTRRGFSKPPISKKIFSTSELDWLASSIQDQTKFPWHKDEHAGPDPEPPIWQVATGDSLHVDDSIQPSTFLQHMLLSSKAVTSQDDKTMILRRDLAQVTNWHGPTSAQAVALATAMEVVLNTLLTNFSDIKNAWKLLIHSGPDLGPKYAAFKLLRKPNGRWRVYADQLDAALSMWRSSQIHKENQQSVRLDQLAKHHGHANDTWLRANGPRPQLSLHILAAYSQSLGTNLSLWLPSGLSNMLEIGQIRETSVDETLQYFEPEDRDDTFLSGSLSFEAHRIVGRSGNGRFPHESRRRANTNNPIRELIHAVSNVLEDSKADGIPTLAPPTRDGDSAAGVFHTDQRIYSTKVRRSPSVLPFEKETCLALQSHDSISSLHAKEMFAAFVWAISKELPEPIAGEAVVQRREKNTQQRGKQRHTHAAWMNIMIQHDVIDQMVQDIYATGLATHEELYAYILVPLCTLERLPAPMSVVDYALTQASLCKIEDSDEATQVFLWLAKITKSWPQSHNSTLQTALIHSLEHLAKMDDIHETFENHQLGRDEEDPVITSQNALRYVLGQSNRGLLRSLYGVYEQQRRQWPLSSISYHSDFVDLPHHKLQPWVASEGPGDERSTDLRTWFDISQDEDAPSPNQVDATGFTALHYKAVGNQVKVGTGVTLDQYREAAEVADLRGWIPLHYSCFFGLSNITTGLIHIGSDCNHQAKDGTTPLHCAAKAGHVEIVRRLVRYEAGVNVRDHFGYTPIFWAAFGGHVDTLKFLMTESKVRISSRFGRTLLHAVVIGNAIEAVKTVAGDTRCSELTEDAQGATPFDLAMRLQNTEVIHWFLSNAKFSGQILQRDPMRVLRQAISQGDSQAVDMILEVWETQTGVAPAYMDFAIEAIKSKQPAIALTLATHQDSRLTQQHEAELLHLAVEKDQRDVIRYFVEVGLDIQTQDEYKKRPIDYATMAANTDLVRFLVNELGVAINPHSFTLLVQSRNFLMARLFLTEFDFEVDTWAVRYMKFDEDPAMKSLLALYRKREEEKRTSFPASSDNEEASLDTRSTTSEDQRSVQKSQWPNWDKISTEKEVVVEELLGSQQRVLATEEPGSDTRLNI